jgi:hypothetical protein
MIDKLYHLLDRSQLSWKGKLYGYVAILEKYTDNFTRMYLRYKP